MNKALDPKGLEAALEVFRRELYEVNGPARYNVVLPKAITAYLSASTPEDVAGLVERAEKRIALWEREDTVGSNFHDDDAEFLREAATALTSLAGERDRLNNAVNQAHGREDELRARAEAAESKLTGSK